MSARIEAAVKRLKIRPGDTVLEIGCGHGVAVDLICQRLRSGMVVAIDRSPAMIAAARRRNSAHVKSGRVEFIAADVLEFDPEGRTFDAILALRVGFFHREPERAQALVNCWLKPGGRIIAEFDEP